MNQLAPSLRNNHLERYSELSNLDPSRGKFKDAGTLANYFAKYKSKITTILKNVNKSGNHTADQELDDEVYTHFIGNGNCKDHILFYCWLEWRDILNGFGWLAQSDQSRDSNQHGITNDDQLLNTINTFIEKMVENDAILAEAMTISTIAGCLAATPHFFDEEMTKVFQNRLRNFMKK